MPRTAATKGRGAILSYSDTVGGTYTEVAEVLKVTVPKVKPVDIETTTNSSVDTLGGGDFKEHVGGWIEPGTLTATIRFDKAVEPALYALVAVSKFFKITYSGGANWIYGGYISGFGDNVEENGQITTEIEVQCSGKPAFAGS